MRIQVKLFGEFRRHVQADTSFANFWLEIREGASVGTLLDALGIPHEAPMTLVHNHRAGSREAVLLDGDIVAVFPPVAGGG
ncbi:MAG: MoaD/ThiS family protein [Thermodesulfobacteriota bacterium]